MTIGLVFIIAGLLLLVTTNPPPYHPLQLGGFAYVCTGFFICGRTFHFYL